MIEISKLQIRRQGNTICRVDRLSIREGEVVIVIGPNGSGKTTLLRVVAGLTTDFHGQCNVRASHRERTFVHQQPLMFRGSVLANVRYGQRDRGGEEGDGLDWLAQLGIAKLATRSTAQLSGGEIRRIALARALACQPKLLILDEPLAELDPTSADTVWQVLNNLENTTILITSPVEVPAALGATRFLLD